MKFDALTFLESNFCSAQELVTRMAVCGVDAPPIGTVYKWFQRKNIPSEWLPILLCVLELDNGEPVRLAPYLR